MMSRTFTTHGKCRIRKTNKAVGYINYHGGAGGNIPICAAVIFSVLHIT